MSAPVTEAHRAITESVCELLDSEEMVGPSPAERAAQLIADSEARAVAEIAMVAAASADRNVSLRLERDQLRAELATCNDASEALVESLRAEVERLKRDYDYDHKCLHEVRERCELWKQRAERAEADADSTRERALTLANSLDEAQAELDAERTRLDWLTMNAHVEPEEYRGGSCSEGGTLWYSWRFSSPRHAGHHASAAIDAAMKEETK